MTFKKPRGFSNSFKKWSKGKKKIELFLPFVADDFEPVDETLTELTRRLGSEQDAKRILKLQQQYPNGTIPELMVMDWLHKGGWRYVYQGELYGGRADSGGLLPDFVVDMGGGSGAAWQVHGDYWHGRSRSKEVRDAEAVLRLTGQTVGGIRIDKVINVWESDLYRNRSAVLNAALAGIALR